MVEPNLRKGPSLFFILGPCEKVKFDLDALDQTNSVQVNLKTRILTEVVEREFSVNVYSNGICNSVNHVKFQY